MAPLPIKLMSLAGSLVILMVFATYFVMPIYYKLADEGDTIGTDFGVNNSLTINNSRELYTQDSLNDHFWVVGVSFAFLVMGFEFRRAVDPKLGDGSQKLFQKVKKIVLIPVEMLQDGKQPLKMFFESCLINSPIFGVGFDIGLITSF